MSSDSPLVSIIITSCNRPNLLKLTLENIFKQTYTNFEILVFLDNCTENYDSIKAFYKNENVQFFITNSKELNPAYPRNMGVRHSSGELVAFCDDDDLWHPQKLEFQLKTILNMSGLKKLVCSNFTLFSDDCELNNFDKISDIGFESNFRPFHLLYKNIIPLSSSLMTKNCFELDHQFNTDRHIIEDWYLWLLFLDSVEIKKITQKLLFYRIHKKSFFTSSKWSLRAKFFRTHYAVFRKSKKFFLQRFLFLLFHMNVSILSKFLIKLGLR